MENIKEIFKEHALKVVLVLLSIILLLGGVFIWSAIQPNVREEAPGMDLHEGLMAEGEGEEIGLGLEPDLVIENQTLEEIIVDVKGAVVTPGVYTVEPNNRVIDAIERAGGFIEEADQNAVNLAKVVEDQMVIYIPKVGEEVQNADLNQASVEPVAEEKTESLVHINLDGKDALMTLNGIGSSKADSILNYREENGFFQTIEEIKNVSGIGDATFENLKDSITVSP